MLAHSLNSIIRPTLHQTFLFQYASTCIGMSHITSSIGAVHAALSSVNTCSSSAPYHVPNISTRMEGSRETTIILWEHTCVRRTT